MPSVKQDAPPSSGHKPKHQQHPERADYHSSSPSSRERTQERNERRQRAEQRKQQAESNNNHHHNGGPKVSSKRGGMQSSQWSSSLQDARCQPSFDVGNEKTNGSDYDAWDAWKVTSNDDWSTGPLVETPPRAPWKQNDACSVSRKPGQMEGQAKRGGMKMVRGDKDDARASEDADQAPRSSSNGDGGTHHQRTPSDAYEDMLDTNGYMSDATRDTVETNGHVSEGTSPQDGAESTATELEAQSISPLPDTASDDSDHGDWPGDNDALGEPDAMVEHDAREEPSLRDWPEPIPAYKPAKKATDKRESSYVENNFMSLIDVPPQQFLNNPVLDISGRWFCDDSECMNRDRPEFIGLCYRDAGERSGHIMVVQEALSAWIAAVKEDERRVEWPDEPLRNQIVEGEATAYTNEVVKGSDQESLLESIKMYGRFEISAQEELKRFFAWIKSRNPNEDFWRVEEFLKEEQCDLNSIRNDFSLEMWRELKLPLGLWGRLRREADAFQKVTDPTLRADDALSTLEKQAIRNGENEERARKGLSSKKPKRKCAKCNKLGHFTEVCWWDSKCGKCGKAGHPSERCWRFDGVYGSAKTSERTWRPDYSNGNSKVFERSWRPNGDGDSINNNEKIKTAASESD